MQVEVTEAEVTDVEIKPEVYDPMLDPELFEGVLARRVIAFAIDLFIIMVPVLLAAMFIFMFGLITLGVGWGLYWLLGPVSIAWGLFYYGSTMGSLASATIGMRAVDIEVRTWFGAPCHYVLGALHASAFWVFMAFPPLLLIGFLNQRQRLLHDLLLGTVVINNAQRAAVLRP